MTEARSCPECNTDLPADAPAGLCPKCLLQRGLRDSGSAGASTGAYPFGPSAAPTPAELAPHFPQLEILELLGQGGMGAVYKARQPGLDRLVALKIVPPQAGRDAAFAERFAREARALAKLNHPNIVGVHDFGQADGLYYFIMEFVDGVNLRQALRAGQLQPAEALRIVPHICAALQYAHEEGVVHRDIKPENILLDRKGRVKIADFGLAKLLGRAPADVRLTATHQVMGTPHYMAPEQMDRPQEVDHRADIYSLGVVFYEMLTGELPLGRFEPPSRMVQVDVRLDQVVLRALEARPERRYQNVSEVKTDVEALTQDEEKADDFTNLVNALAATIFTLLVVAYAMWVWNSAWGLLGLCVPWLLWGFTEERGEDWDYWLPFTSCLLGTSALIGWGIDLASSAWPLLAGIPLALEIALQVRAARRHRSTADWEKWLDKQGAPMAHVSFCIPHVPNLGSRLVFHCNAFGFRLVKQAPNEWIFRRGNKAAAWWRFNIRAYFTILKVSALPDATGSVRLSCGWYVWLVFGNVVIARDVQSLETEGRQLESLLNENKERQDAGTR